MITALDVISSPRLVGLISNVLAVWFSLALSIYLLTVFGSNLGAESQSAGPRDAPWTLPGEFIGGVWFCLYTLMALSLWILNGAQVDNALTKKWAVIVLIVFCLVWPFYAFDTPNRLPGLLGNAGIFVITTFAILYIWPSSRIDACVLAPVALWILVASATIVDGARRYGW